MLQLDRVNELKLIAKDLEKSKNKMNNLKNRFSKASPRLQKTITNEIKELDKQISKDMHEIHCIAVELKIAQPEPERYGIKNGEYYREPNINPERKECLSL